MSADNTFFLKNTNIRFIVKNKSSNRRIKIFNYPIEPGLTRDLLSIPQISESDIRHSLIKGELSFLLQNKVIEVIYSDIDLLQFNQEQKQFLKNNGVSLGTEMVDFSTAQTDIIDQKNQVILAAANAYTDVQTNNVANILTVGLTGAGYTSIKDAVIVANLASDVNNQYTVEVSPGTYYEDPFSIGPYITVIGIGSLYSVIIIANNNTAHFIDMMASSSLINCSISGPTGNGFAAIHSNDTSSVPAIIDHVAIMRGYYGVYLHPLSTATIHLQYVVNHYVGSPIHYFCYVTDYGKLIASNSGYMNGPPGSLNTCFYISGSNASARFDSCFQLCQGSTGIFADDGAYVRATALTITEGNIGIHIGGSGTGTQINCSATTLGFSLTNSIKIDTDTAILTFIGSADTHTANFGGANISGIFNDPIDPDPGTHIMGNLFIGEESAQFPIGEYARATASSEVSFGGEAVLAGGLDISVAAGVGYVSISENILKKVTWNSQIITVPQHYDRGWVIIDEFGVINTTNVSPNKYLNFEICEFVSNNTRVLAINGHRHPLTQHIVDATGYAEDVIGPVHISGGATTKNDIISLKLNVSTATFYTANNKKTAPGNMPIIYTSWYRSGSSWVKTYGNTDIDTDYYDNGSGSLVGVPLGKYKRDLLYVATDGYTSTYHVVYGTQVFDSAVEATVDPSTPSFLANSALRLAAIISQQGNNDIVSILDGRPRLGQNFPTVQSGVTDHGALSGLGNDDHLQYQLRTEKGIANGYAGLNVSLKVPSTNLPLTSTAPEFVDANSASVGVSTEIARSDHKHDILIGSPISLSVGASASDGVAVSVALSDHSHAFPAPGVPVNITKAAAAAGTSIKVAREDHKHDISTAVASSLSVGGSNTEGVATTLTRSDHTHSLPAFGSSAGTFTEGNDSRLSDDRIAHSLRTATTSVVISTSAAPTAGQLLIALSSTLASWQTLLTSTAPINVDKSAAITGVSTEAARTDHKHNITTATAVITGSSNTEGTSTSLSRADHVHIAAPPCVEITSTTPFNITSATDVLIAGMTTIPTAGNHMVWFDGAIVVPAGATTTVTISLYYNGVQITSSSRTLKNNTAAQTLGVSASTMSKIIADGISTLEVRVRRSSGTGTVSERSLMYMRVT